MSEHTTLAILPVGELFSEQANSKFEDMVHVFKSMEIDKLVLDPVASVEEAQDSVLKAAGLDPDLLVLVPLRGLSALVIEAALRASRCPCLVCPVQGEYALPSSALAIGAVADSLVPVELLYAPPEFPEFITRLSVMIRAARAYSHIKMSRIGVIGGLFPNLVSCKVDAEAVNSKLGVKIRSIGFDRVRRSIQEMDKKSTQVEHLMLEAAGSFSGDAQDGSLVRGILLHTALKSIAAEEKLDGFAAECWSAFPQELGCNPCLGHFEDAYTLACEGDLQLCISLLIVRFLTGQSPFAGDLYDLDMDGILTLVHCGAPASLARDKESLVLVKSERALERGFETVTCRPKLQEGPVTVFRLYGEDCSRMHLAAGELLSCSRSPDLQARVRIRGDRRDFLEHCFGNHYVVVSGDIRKELKLLSKWLGITLFET